MSERPGARTKRRIALGVGGGVLSVLCCVGFLFARLLVRCFPISLSAPRLNGEQPLGEGEAIAFSYMRVDLLRPFELCVLDESSRIRSLSQGLVRSDLGAAWSPDGAQVAYASVRGGEPRLYLVAADGSSRRPIAASDSIQDQPRWSPDGSLLAYLSYDRLPDGSTSRIPHLCVVDAATGAERRVAHDPIQDYVWMPDGRALLAIVQAEDQVAASLYQVDGASGRRVSELPAVRDPMNVALSPDGDQVAYVLPAVGDNVESQPDSLCISALVGLPPRCTDVSWAGTSIVWAPDSTRVAFVALTDDFEYALYVMRAEGGEPQELMLLNPGDESGEVIPALPAWSPDGAHLVVASYLTPDGSALLVMDANGTERRQITAVASGMIYDLAWRPK